MKYIENIVIGKLLVEPKELFAANDFDWKNYEEEQTHFTEETYLPKILVEIGMYNSINQIRKNSPKFDISFEKSKYDFLKLKIGKKILYIAVGD